MKLCLTAGEPGDASQLGDQCPVTGQLLWERGEGGSVSKQHCQPHLGSTASILGLIELLVSLANHRERTGYEPVHLSGVFHWSWVTELFTYYWQGLRCHHLSALHHVVFTQPRTYPAFSLLSLLSLPVRRLHCLGFSTCVLSCFSCVRLFVTLWIVAFQAPLPMGFSRQEYWVGCHFFCQRIFLNQGLNLCLLCLLHWQATLSLVPPGNDISIAYIWMEA